MRNHGSETYRPAAGVVSVWDEGGIRLVSHDGATKQLTQLESAVWQLTASRVPDGLLLRFFASLRKTSKADAGRFVQKLRNRWLRLRLLERSH